jgi:hypothetical protein
MRAHPAQAPSNERRIEVIKDAKGRKWFMRFKQHRQGWYWEARHGNQGQSSGWSSFFETKALAEEDARRSIQNRDAIAEMQEYFRRLRKQGTECQLTAADHEAIARVGTNKASAR